MGGALAKQQAPHADHHGNHGNEGGDQARADMHLGLRNHAHAAAQHQATNDEGVQPLPPRGQAGHTIAP